MVGAIYEVSPGVGQSYTPSSPYSSSVFDMEADKDGRLWVTSGGVIGDYVGYTFSKNGFYVLEDQWINFNTNNNPGIIDRINLISFA